MTTKKISCRIFINNKQIEELNRAERKQFAERCTDQMGQVLNDYFGQHPDVYERVCKEREESPVLQV